MVKITNLKSLTWGAKWPTLGNIATSSFTPEESPDPGFWVPNWLCSSQSSTER